MRRSGQSCGFAVSAASWLGVSVQAMLFSSRRPSKCFPSTSRESSVNVRELDFDRPLGFPRERVRNGSLTYSLCAFQEENGSSTAMFNLPARVSSASLH